MLLTLGYVWANCAYDQDDEVSSAAFMSASGSISNFSVDSFFEVFVLSSMLSSMLFDSESSEGMFFRGDAGRKPFACWTSNRRKTSRDRIIFGCSATAIKHKQYRVQLMYEASMLCSSALLAAFCRWSQGINIGRLERMEMTWLAGAAGVPSAVPRHHLSSRLEQVKDLATL